MRATSLILLSALAGLWGYYALEVAEQGVSPPVRMPVESNGETNAASLNNTGVMLDRNGHPADALAYFERARTFRPKSAVIGANYARQKARVRQEGWWRVLLVASVAVAILVVGGGIWRGTRRALDQARLARLRLHGRRWLHVDTKDQKAALELSFSEPVNGLARRHPPNVVWTCAARNQHMKSRRCVKVKGRECRIRLEGKRLAQLRRYPGDWRCILRLGKTEVGEATARVG